MVVPRSTVTFGLLGGLWLIGIAILAPGDLARAAQAGVDDYGTALAVWIMHGLLSVVFLGIGVSYLLTGYPFRRVREQWTGRLEITSGETYVIGPIRGLSGKALIATLKGELPQSLWSPPRSFRIVREGDVPSLQYQLRLVGRDSGQERVVYQKSIEQKMDIYGKPLTEEQKTPEWDEIEMPIEETFIECYLYVQAALCDSRSGKSRSVPANMLDGGVGLPVQVHLSVGVRFQEASSPRVSFDQVSAHRVDSIP